MAAEAAAAVALCADGEVVAAEDFALEAAVGSSE